MNAMNFMNANVGKTFHDLGTHHFLGEAKTAKTPKKRSAEVQHIP